MAAECAIVEVGVKQMCGGVVEMRWYQLTGSRGKCRRRSRVLEMSSSEAPLQGTGNLALRRKPIRVSAVPSTLSQTTRALTALRHADPATARFSYSTYDQRHTFTSRHCTHHA
jgi:hypothetical protein